MARHTGLHFKRKKTTSFPGDKFQGHYPNEVESHEWNGTLASRDKEGGSARGWQRTRAGKLRTFRRTTFSVGWTYQWASERTFHSVIRDSNNFSKSSKSAQNRKQTKPGNLCNQSDKDNEV